MKKHTTGISSISKYKLTEGSILDKLLLVSLPIMGTQIVQMTYNLTDMFWLGRVGGDAVAASGTVGMYLWLAIAFQMYGRMGAEIGVSQNLGRDDEETAKKFGQSAFVLSVVIGILYGLALIIFHKPLIGFFNIKEQQVAAAAENYLIIVSTGIPFTFVTAAVTGVFNGSGNSKIPFYINAVGLIINMVLDPLLIFNGNMGIGGAAIATVLAQAVACVLSVLALLFYKHRPFHDFKITVLPGKSTVQQIFIWATPIAVESFLFTFLSMILSRFVAAYGAGAIAVQRVSNQIESLSWLIAGGFSSALTAFIGQNFGAGKWSRIHKGFKISLGIMAIWGIITTLILFFGGSVMFALFLPGEPEVIQMGEAVLKILALCQFTGCTEAIASGAFRGIGQTAPPSIVSTASNAIRVVGAYFASRTPMGLDGIWWAISLGAVLRGVWLYLWYVRVEKHMPRQDVKIIG